MKLLFFVLEQNDKLDDVLVSLTDHGIVGATVLEGKGMMKLLAEHDEGEVPVFGAIRHYLNPDRVKRTLIFMGIQDEQLEIAVQAIEDVVGNLNEKDTGVIFSVPVDFAKGLYNDGN